VTKDQVDAQIEQLRDNKATLTPVADKPLPGDLVNVLISTGSEGESAEPKSYPIELGAQQAIAGIEELIMEAAPGETVERPVKWPDDFPDEKQRGQTKLVRVTVEDVKRKSLPELDDAFAREVGDFDSLESLRTAVTEDLTRHAGHEADAVVRQKLIEEIIASNKFDVPKSWIQELVSNYAKAYGVPEDQLESFANEFRSIAEKQIRRDLVIDTIAEKESLAATEKDIDAKIAEQAERRKTSPGQLYASLEKAGRIKEIERSITEDKVFSWLLERNEVQTNA
jgi:trigger factor